MLNDVVCVQCCYAKQGSGVKARSKQGRDYLSVARGK